jgi:uncharacterized protein (TIGR02996 family)
MARKKAPPQEQAFLADVIASGGDEAPGLVFADWLEDNGQAHRAEFVRLQCRLAALDEFAPERQELEQREWELLAVYRDDWLQGLPAWVREGGTPDFRRGFVGQAHVRASDFLRKGAGLFAAAPIRDLHLRGIGDRWAEVAASPLLARLSALDVSENRAKPEALYALLTSPHLTGLTDLRLRSVGLSPGSAGVVAWWPGLSQLQSLDLGSNGVGNDEAEALAARHTSARCGGCAWRGTV